jgi:hypothetical protein
MCKDQQFDTEETRCVLAILEFIVSNAAKHDVTEATLTKDLLQMGVEVEHGEGIVKIYSENQTQLVKAKINQSLRISQIDRIQYKVSYLMASSMTGKRLIEEEEGSE